MDSSKKDIKLIVDDEQSLYVSFSSEDEFDESVKSYIRSKLSDGMHNRQGIDMTVISREPMNEERFRSAVSNWIREEKVLFKKREKETVISLIGGLFFGSLLLILSIIMEQRIEVLKYSLLPIMGSLALGSAARTLAVDIPTIRVERWFFNEIEKNSVITFECVHDEDSSPDKKLV